MRFSLQHLFVLVLLCAGVVALDAGFYGQPDLRYWFTNVFYLSCGFAAGLLFYFKWGQKKDVAPLWPGVLGAVVIAVFLVIHSGLAVVPEVDICSRTQQIRFIRDLGLVRWTTVRETPESRIIRDELGYTLSGLNNWVEHTRYDKNVGHVFVTPLHQRILFATPEELHALKVLKPEQIRNILEQDSTYDHSFMSFRSRLIFGHAHRDSIFPEPTREQIEKRLLLVHEKYGMFMQSFKTEADVYNALRTFRRSPDWDAEIDRHFCDAITGAGLQIPNDVPGPK